MKLKIKNCSLFSDYFVIGEWEPITIFFIIFLSEVFILAYFFLLVNINQQGWYFEK